MYLSDRDLRWALEKGQLIVDPPPEKIGLDSIDLHLDRVEEAKVWDVEKLKQRDAARGITRPEVFLGTFKYAALARDFLISPPEEHDAPGAKVARRGHCIVVHPGGFLLWQTRERVGTPKTNPALVCFVDGQSTKARTGLLVHLTAPTIHCGWAGRITLEIANLGPLDFVLKEGDVIAQIMVASLSSTPEQTQEQAGSTTLEQVDVMAQAPPTE